MPVNKQAQLSEIGLPAFLDGSKDFHNGRGFNEFIAGYILYKNGEKTVTDMADDFGVTRPTMYNWIEWHVSHQSKA